MERQLKEMQEQMEMMKKKLEEKQKLKRNKDSLTQVDMVIFWDLGKSVFGSSSINYSCYSSPLPVTGKKRPDRDPQSKADPV